MHIETECPRCRSRFHVQPSLAGKPMRCPAEGCRNIFVVRDIAAEAPRSIPAPHGQQTGSVGDLIPVLPAEQAAPVTPPEREAGYPDVERPPSWHEPPPVRRGPNGPAPARETVADASPDVPPPEEDGPRVFQPGAWEMPPVRRGAEAEAFAPTPAEHAPDPTPAAGEPVETLGHHRPAGRWARWVILPFFVAVLGGLGVGVYLVAIAGRKSEEKMAQTADGFYNDGQFSAAYQEYGQLANEFPSSEHLDRYRFLRALSELRDTMSHAGEDPVEMVRGARDFVQERAKDPLLVTYAPDVGKSVMKVVTAFTDKAAKAPGEGDPGKVVGKIDALLQELQGVKKVKVLTKADRQRFDEESAKVNRAVAAWRHRQGIPVRLRELAKKHSPFEAIGEAERLVVEEETALPGLRSQADVAAALKELYDAHAASVVYKAGEPPEPLPAAEEGDPGLLFYPQIRGAAGAASADGPIVLALARGVLYALDEGNGQVRWAMRVGVDTTNLPVRVPASESSAERILVLSSSDADARGPQGRRGQTLSVLDALDRDGNTLWRYRLSGPVLGRPLVVGQPPRAYLPTYDGVVYEIELARGKLLGRYELGQPLTVGGTREPGSDRLYFPADDGCVYVLDVGKRRLDKLLYTGHLSGSIRSEPLIVGPPAGVGRRYLVLNQSDGLHATELRVYELPLKTPRDKPAGIDPEPRLPGWTWFRPHQDDEKLVLLSDAGVLGMFGVRQRFTKDAPLFPLLAPGGIDLGPYLNNPRLGRTRAEVVEVQGDDLWVLARGQLQRLRLAWGARQGPQLIKGWKDALEVGAPLHASQVPEDPETGLSTLVVVTQPPGKPVCWATAVRDRRDVGEAEVVWRRQLGLSCLGPPLLLTPEGGGAPVVLAQDQGGGLFTIDPELYKDRPDRLWHKDRSARLAAALEENAEQRPPLLLPGPDGRTAYQVASPGDGKALVVREVRFGEGRELKLAQERKVPLPLESTLGGTPAVVGSRLVLPLAAGPLARLPLPLPEEIEFEADPEWRSPGAPADSRAHVVALSDDRFLVAEDGGTGLTVWEWPAGRDTHQKLPKGAKVPAYTLPGRALTPPLRLPPRKDGEPVRVLVADAGGALRLLAVRPGGSLEEERSWALDGRVTAGPFLRALPGGATRVGCVVEESRLVWVDPYRAKGVWDYRTAKGDAIVGEPALVEDLVVVAHQSGHLVGLDPADLKAAGPGHSLRGGLAPAVSPLPFGKGRVLAPLADGTALVLPLERVRHPLRRFPSAW